MSNMAATSMEGGRLWLLQERLKQERLFVMKEKAAINVLNSEVQATCEKLFHLSWITSQQWRNLQRLQAHPSKSSYATSLLDSATFIDAYKKLGYLESKYGDFLKALRENPKLVASTLAFADASSSNMDMIIKQVIRLLLNSLYGNCLLPEDENYVLMLMKSLIGLQILRSEQPETFFRSPRNWSFTIIFGVLVESLFSAKLYLTAALHTQILQVLAKDSRIKAKLPYICSRFVQSLEEKLYCFPSSLRWLVRQLYNMLKTSGKLSERESKSMVSELLFNYFICPAIINPEPYGINSDMQVSKTARENLQQISSLLCKRCTAPWQGKGLLSGGEDLFGSLDANCISSFIDAILEGAEQMKDFPAEHTLPDLCCSSVLITENELRALELEDIEERVLVEFSTAFEFDFIQVFLESHGVCNEVSTQGRNAISATAFLKMVQHWDELPDFISQKELSELLVCLPPDPKATSKQTTPNPITTPVSGESPQVQHKHGKLSRFVKIKNKDSVVDTPSQDEAEGERKIAAVTLLSPLTPAVSKSQGYKQECLTRLGQLFQKDEDVLVVPLGYSSVDLPGMLPEDKVLGIKKPEVVKKERLKSSSEQSHFRSRTSSNKFTEFFSKISTEKELNKLDSESSGNEFETSEDHFNVSEAAASLPQLLQPHQAHEIRLHQPQQIDLVQGTTGMTAQQGPGVDVVQAGPDVLESGSQHHYGSHHDTVDLIDFDDIIVDSSSTKANVTSQPCFSPIGRPISLEQTELSRSSSHSSACSATRDSTISTGSSAHDSTCSDRYSALDSGFTDNIEQSNMRSQANRNSTISEVSTDVDHLSVISTVSRESVSSGTVIGQQGSNRDSEASILSEDFQDRDIQRSGSSSTQDDDLDLRDRKMSKSKKSAKKAGSLKRVIQRKVPFADHKARREGRRRSSPDIEGEEGQGKREKKKRGFLGHFRGKKDDVSSVRTKQSGTKVYQELEDQALDIFGMPPAIPQDQFVEERTPKDITEELFAKYKEIAKMAENAADGDTDQNHESDEEQDDEWDEAERFSDTKRKLRLVLCQADFRNLPWLMSEERVTQNSPSFCSNARELMTFLHIQLAEAINLQNRSLAAQLHETIRSVKQLPDGSCPKILVSLEDNYKARMPYLAYLTRSRQALLTTHAHLERLVDRVQRNKLICKKCFVTNCVTLFLEAREKEINTFIKGFQNNCPTPDEKCRFVEQFLEKLYTELDRDEVWLGATRDQLDEGYIALERDIMGRIYSYAFYPNGDIDIERDKAFTQHVERLQTVVGMNHKAIRIPKMYRKEAPWPSAQQELNTINAYKTPTDKLKCVQRCCFTIMNLLNMACASDTREPAGADEFVPAFVWVLIHANPPSLLSTIQYVNNFYGQRLSGEEAWSWTQFYTAVEYTKTIQG